MLANIYPSKTNVEPQEIFGKNRWEVTFLELYDLKVCFYSLYLSKAPSALAGISVVMS